MEREKLYLLLRVSAAVTVFAALMTAALGPSAQSILFVGASVFGFYLALNPVRRRSRDQLVAAWKWTVVLLVPTVCAEILITTMVASALNRTLLLTALFGVVAIAALVMRSRLHD